jgi:hypothetical protein
MKERRMEGIFRLNFAPSRFVYEGLVFSKS